MARIKPYAGTSKDRLSALISKSQTPVLPSAVSYVFSNMREGTSSVDGATDITVVASIGSRVDAPEDVSYQRLDIDVLSLLPSEEIELVPALEVPFSIHDILGEINTALGINLLPEEVVNEEFTEQSEIFPLTITSESLAWVPSVYMFRMASLDIDLQVAIPDPVLEGLEYLQPVI